MRGSLPGVKNGRTGNVPESRCSAGYCRKRLTGKMMQIRKSRMPIRSLYKLHVRGFTAHASSNVSARGTYAGIVEKIPYLKDLGITAVELMPVTEFDEVMMSSSGNGFHDAKPEPTGYINYWGYGPSYLYAVKSAYASQGRCRRRRPV